MCLIIAPGPDGQKALLPRDVFDYVFDRNNDGLGGMYVKDGRVEHFKALDLTADQEYSYMEEMVERHPDVIFHMRYKTHGPVIPALCHPFRILHKNRHGRDLFFMHNGVLSEFGRTLSYGASDTTNFKNKVLVPLLTRNPDALDDPEILQALNKLTSGSRLIFLDSEGKVYRTSETSWVNRYGLRLSNTYMLPAEPKPSYGYGYGDEEWKEEWKKAESKLNDDNKKVIEIGSPSNDDVKAEFPLFRRVVYSKGSESKFWAKQVKKGFIRSQFGSLYRDRGTGISLYHDRDYIPKAKEFDALMEEEAKQPYVPATDDDLNDDLPWGGPQTDGKIPASVGERLRYARLVHNCNSGTITSRPQLLADLLGMDNAELFGFIKEDPENATIVMGELYEIVLEMNDLIKDEEDNDLSFSYDELLSLGRDEYHPHAMKEITKIRKDQYAEALRLKQAVDEATQTEEEEANVA